MNRILMSTPALTKVRNTKSKRVLQVLQVSASDKDLLVSPSLMSGKGKKPVVSEKKSENFQDELMSKENTPVAPNVRRSKRKNAAAQEQPKKAEVKEETEPKAASNKVSKVTKSKKTKSRKIKIATATSDPKQSTMDSFVANGATLSTVNETSLVNDRGSVDNGKNLEIIPVSPPEGEDILMQQSKNFVEAAVSPIKPSDTSKDSGICISPNMLISANPPESYWKILAEERRVALEETLRENVQLYDQLQVLETENSQLKSCLKEAEKLATVLRQALE